MVRVAVRSVAGEVTRDVDRMTGAVLGRVGEQVRDDLREAQAIPARDDRPVYVQMNEPQLAFRARLSCRTGARRSLLADQLREIDRLLAHEGGDLPLVMRDTSRSSPTSFVIRSTCLTESLSLSRRRWLSVAMRKRTFELESERGERRVELVAGDGEKFVAVANGGAGLPGRGSRSRRQPRLARPACSSMSRSSASYERSRRTMRADGERREQLRPRDTSGTTIHRRARARRAPATRAEAVETVVSSVPKLREPCRTAGCSSAESHRKQPIF